MHHWAYQFLLELTRRRADAGIGDKVDHRRLILPQLSATGVERKLVEERTGWHIVFGPVYACDLPAYLATERKTSDMRQVRFPLHSRLEMAIAWAFPISVVCGLILAVGWRHLVLPFVALVWGISAVLFVFFPWLHARIWPAGQRKPGWTRYLIFFDPAIRRYLLVWVAFVVGLCVDAYGWGNGNTWRLVGWSLAGLFIVLLVSMDMAGSTPTYKSGLHEDRLLHIELDSKACKGRAMCWEVCPKNCYLIDTHLHKAVIALPDACVQCGACVSAQRMPWHLSASMGSGYRPRSFALTSSTCWVNVPSGCLGAVRDRKSSRFFRQRLRNGEAKSASAKNTTSVCSCLRDAAR